MTTSATTIPKGLVSTINTFVKSFLSGEDASVEAWTSPANQKLLKVALSGKKPVRGGEQKKEEKPKKSKSAYLFFCEEERSRIKQAQPELKSTEITVLLGQRWNALKKDSSRASELASYEKKASADNERYVKEKGQVDTTKAKSSEKPKKPKSAYLLFCEETRPVVKKEMPDLSAKEIISELARRWQLSKQE
jgi:HMG (high mobility group) box